MSRMIRTGDYVEQDGRGAVVVGVVNDDMKVRWLGTYDTAKFQRAELTLVGFCRDCKQTSHHKRDCSRVNPQALAMLGKEALVIKIK
jgi:hypothetical protein